MIKKIHIDDFIKGAKLGSGMFSEVFLVTDKRTSKKYAAKKVNNELEGSEDKYLDDLTDLKREIEIMSVTSYPAIIAFYGYSPYFFDHTLYPTLIMEFASNKSLGNFLESARKGLLQVVLDPTIKFILVYGIAKGMAYLHSKNIIHRDLKPDNILLTESHYPKISDFGFSKIADPMQSLNSKKCGTMVYMPPEVFESDDYQYNNKVDVYAYAMIIYEIFTLEKPFAKLSEFALMRTIMNNQRPHFPDDSTSEEFIQIIKKCWSQDPDERPTFEEICEELEKDNFSVGKNIKVDMETFDLYQEYLKNQVDDDMPPSKVDDDNNNNTSNQAVKETKTIQFDFSHEKSDDSVVKSKRRATLPRKPKNQPDSRPKIDKIDSDKNYLESAEKGDSNAMAIVGQWLVKGDNKDFPQNVEKGVEFLQKSAELNNPESMIIYGEMLLNGTNVPKNVQEGISLLKRASNNFDSSQAKLKLAEYYLKSEKDENGQTISLPNYPQAKRYSKEAADNGNVEAMVLYSKLCMREHNNQHGKIRRNLKEAVKYLKIAIQNESIEAYNVYGQLKEQCFGIKEINIHEAKKLYKKSQKKGDVEGKGHYGYITIKTANNDKEKEKEGLNMIMESKEKKNPTGINNYGLLILNGLCGLPVNQKEAAACFKEAADAGNANAMYNYAKCLEKGTGIDKNFKEAYKYYKFAFERGETRAAKNIADMLFKGDDESHFPKHLDSGNRYLKTLADYGNAAGINLYASNLLEGFGIEKNENEAVFYLKNGIEKNDSNSLLLYGLYLLTQKTKTNADPTAYIKKAVKLGNEKAKAKCDVFCKGGFNAKRNLEETIKYIRTVYSND